MPLIISLLSALFTQPAPAGPGPIVGSWRNAQGAARFNADGTAMVDGENGRYQIAGDKITLTGTKGSLTLQFALLGDTLTLIGPGGATVLNRVKEEAGPGRVHPEMVGKWCWISVTNAQGGGRTSDQCITLAADGTYQYFGQVASSNPNGSTASETGDAGTWTATETTLTAHSRRGITVTYTLEKRNHPKTGDPMLVLNGQPFVTYFQHPRW